MHTALKPYTNFDLRPYFPKFQSPLSSVGKKLQTYFNLTRTKGLSNGEKTKIEKTYPKNNKIAGTVGKSATDQARNQTAEYPLSQENPII